jgi:hypothetical protein
MRCCRAKIILTVKEGDGSIEVSKEDELGARLHSRE